MGNLVLKAEELKRGSRSLYKIKFQGQNFKPPAIFYRLYKQLANGQFVAIYESETSNRTETGKHEFKLAEVHSAGLINDDESRKAMIEVFQW